MKSACGVCFLPDHAHARRKFRRSNRACAAMLAVGIFTSSMVLIIAKHRLNTAQSDRFSAMQEYSDVAEQMNQLNNAVHYRQELATQIEVEQNTLKSISGTRLLSEVTDALPPGLSFNQLEFTARDSRVHVTGNASDSAGISRFTRTLRGSELFANVDTDQVHNALANSNFEISILLAGDADWSNNPSSPSTTTVLLDGGEVTR